MAKSIIGVTPFFVQDGIPDVGVAQAHGRTFVAGDTFVVCGVANNRDYETCDISDVVLAGQTFLVSRKLNFGPGNRMLAFGYRTTVGSSPGTTVTIQYTQPSLNRVLWMGVHMREMEVAPLDRTGAAAVSPTTPTLNVVADAPNVNASGFAIAVIGADDQYTPAGGLAVPVGVGGWVLRGSANIGTVAPYHTAAIATLDYNVSETSQAQWAGIDDFSSPNGAGGIIMTYKALVIAPGGQPATRRTAKIVRKRWRSGWIARSSILVPNYG